MKMWECEDINKLNISNMQVTSRILVCIPHDCVYISRYVYISNGIYLIIFWCTIQKPICIRKVFFILQMFKNLKPMLVLFYKNVLLIKYILLVLLFWLIIWVPGSYFFLKKKHCFLHNCCFLMFLVA